MPELVNPFHELYLTETISADDYVKVFSDFLVKPALPLFQPGNIVLCGVQGSGKSMLLGLLKPEIRLAYARAGVPFPVPAELAGFIGAGINITRSSAIDFGQRPITDDPNVDAAQFPVYFGDFLNYWIVRDVLRSLEKLQTELEGKVAREMGITRDSGRLDAFARYLSQEACWSGYLSEVDSFGSLKSRINWRLSQYRDFLNFNIKEMPAEISTSKTPVGEPISRMAKVLWDCKVIPESVHLLIRIDQYEELLEISHGTPDSGIGRRYAEVVNKAVGSRDPRISYRIGVRPYAWRAQDLTVFGTASLLEEERNYRVIDIDDILRRREVSTNFFRRFAEDVCLKRLRYAKYNIPTSSRKMLTSVFGAGPSAEEKAEKYAKSSPGSIIREESEWPDDVRACLLELAKVNRLSAKLGEAWVRQQLVRKEPDLPKTGYYPWKETRRQWWKKERTQQALMQIAASQRQRMIWAGHNDVVAVSGSNILVFVSVCQHIWAAWLRSVRGEERNFKEGELPSFDWSIQNEGIQNASRYWHGKITERPNGEARQRFADHLGRHFRSGLLKDFRMSYPGANGFSLAAHDLEKNGDILTFLNDSVDYGALVDALHTTKNKARERRTKWYLNPILSPHFEVPAIHTKEPLYVSANEVREWLVAAKAIAGGLSPSGGMGKKRPAKGPSDQQLPLFE